MSYEYYRIEPIKNFIRIYRINMDNGYTEFYSNKQWIKSAFNKSDLGDSRNHFKKTPKNELFLEFL